MTDMYIFMCVCVVIFQLEKQKRLERIRQKRAQLEELILQVCTTLVCVCLYVCVCEVLLGKLSSLAAKIPKSTTYGNHL